MAYYKNLMNILTVNIEYTLPDIIKLMNVSSNKQIYIIGALKLAISNNEIEQIINPNIKTKYVGHKYKLISKNTYSPTELDYSSDTN